MSGRKSATKGTFETNWLTVIPKPYITDAEVKSDPASAVPRFRMTWINPLSHALRMRTNMAAKKIIVPQSIPLTISKRRLENRMTGSAAATAIIGSWMSDHEDFTVEV